MCLFIWSKYFSSYHLITFLLTKAETSPTEGLSLQIALWLFIKSSSNMAAKLWHLPDRPSWLENIHFIKGLKWLLVLGVIYWWPSADGVLFTANCCGTICTSKSVFLYLWHFFPIPEGANANVHLKKKLFWAPVFIFLPHSTNTDQQWLSLCLHRQSLLADTWILCVCKRKFL